MVPPHARDSWQMTSRMTDDTIIQWDGESLSELGVVIMSTQPLVLHGQIRPDGTLQVEEKVNLPPGPVSVTVQAMTTAARKPTLQVLREIWAERDSRGVVGRSAEEIDAEIDAMRNEDEQRMEDIESIRQQLSDNQG